MIDIEENKLLNLVKTLSEDKLTTKTTTTPVGKIVSKGITGELTLTERLMEKKFTIRLSSRFQFAHSVDPIRDQDFDKR